MNASVDSNRVNSTGTGAIDGFGNSAEENVTDILDRVDFGRSEVPQWAVTLFFVLVCVGVLLGICVIVGLMKCKRRGIILLLRQLIIADVLTVFLVIPEVILLRNGSWIFSSELCPAFLGGEVLFNCLTVYFIICLNFHIISVWNLHMHEACKGNKNPLTSCNEDDSNECLVKKNESPSTSRHLTIDYRKKKTDVSIIFPSLLVWFTCLSLGVPQYTLSTTLRLNNEFFNATLCTVIDAHYENILQNLLLAFKVIIPLILLTFSFCLLLAKLFQSRANSVENTRTLSKNLAATKPLIVFCLVLTVTYILTTLPRSIVYAMHVTGKEVKCNNLENFKIPPFFNMYLSEFHATLLTMLHYSSIPFRTVLCLIFLPTFRKFIKNKILLCYEKPEE